MQCEKHDLWVTGCEECLRSVIASPFKQRWAARVKEIVRDFSVSVDKKKDETSARRFAILIGETILEMLAGTPRIVDYLPIIEKDHYDLALRQKLYCDPIPAEETFKAGLGDRVLTVWGVDRRSGLESSTCNLKDWTLEALTEAFGKEEKDEPGRQADFGDRSFEEFGLEEAGIG